VRLEEDRKAVNVDSNDRVVNIVGIAVEVEIEIEIGEGRRVLRRSSVGSCWTINLNQGSSYSVPVQVMCLLPVAVTVSVFLRNVLRSLSYCV